MTKLLALCALIIFLVGCKPSSKTDSTGAAIVTGLVSPPSDCDCGWEPGDSNVQFNAPNKESHNKK